MYVYSTDTDQDHRVFYGKITVCKYDIKENCKELNNTSSHFIFAERSLFRNGLLQNVATNKIRIKHFRDPYTAKNVV